MAKLLVLYGTSSGNTGIIAENIQDALSKVFNDVTLKNVTEIDPKELANFDILIVGSSTWDEGQLQYDFRMFVEELNDNPPDLKGKKYAVFSLGDSMYQHFCQAGDKLVEAFDKYGAEKVGGILRIDGFPETPENEEATNKWLNEVTSKIK